jgi:hypothetical protein
MPNEQITVPLFTAGEVLTAADMNLSAGTGVPVFTNSTTRDAGFGGAGEKVLAEGQLCYLSDSNIVQYYSGSVWATVGPSTPTASTTAFVSTQQLTSSASYVALTTAVAVTATTGTSALVVATATLKSDATDKEAMMSVAVSGATTIAASDNYNGSIKQSDTVANAGCTVAVFYVFTTLTAGSNTFSQQYKVDNVGNLYAKNRRITVFPL